ncbi:MAG: hypothetical protein GY896_24760 [Gammaproteobacteria bacterium]|nr:hypothetical protein [Gammaproteobacteria bacterium]
MFNEILTVWSNQAGISATIWLAILVFVAYLARNPAHALIRSTGRAIYVACRLFSTSLRHLESNLQRRNKEVVLALGQDACERAIEREFHRVNAVVTRDLSAYPALHRQISDTIDRIEVDYQAATDAPPLPPAWLDAVDSIASIPRTGDATVCSILDNIGKTLESAHQETQKAYRKSTLGRHKLLGAMQPQWRNLGQSLTRVKETIDGLEERSIEIDRQMKSYESIRNKEDTVARTLSSSSLTQFFISTLVLVIAVFGGLINFQLIAMPMSEMVGGTSYIGPMRTSDIAALVIIMVEIAMGLFLMESLRITHLFPIIGSMDDSMRKRMVVITFSILAILATVEASLAYMRDLLALDREALTQSLAGTGVVAEAEFRWIPSLGQMIMGFILPFALAFVAIPLESFIHSMRTVLGMIALTLIHSVAFVARLVGGTARQFSNMLVSLYDLFIMLPLGIERLITSSIKRKQKPASADEVRDLYMEEQS